LTGSVILQAVALAPEQHADHLARRDARRDLARRLFGRDYRLRLVMRPRRGGEHIAAVGDRLLDGREQLGGVEDPVGPRRRDPGARVRPAVARLDQAQLREAEIGHRARGRADIVAELRFHQDHAGAGLLHPVLGFVGPGSWHS
jgi:hypothetical protein